MRPRSVLAAAVAGLAVTAAPAAAETVYGVTAQNRLVTFDSASPGTIRTEVPIRNLPAGRTVAGIDVRPATLQLTLLDDTGQLYTLDEVTGVLRPVGAGTGIVDARDIDFNPTVDRIRVVGHAGAAGQTNPDGPRNGNQRANPNTGGGVTPVDGNLAFAAGDPSTGVPVVPATAYTNAFPASQTYPNAPTTTQFDLEAGNDVLVRQAPPNDGTLTTIGKLGVDVTADGASGFDIVTDADGTTNRAYAALGSAAAPAFYGVNLTTGAATKVGDLGAPVVDIAVAPVVPTLIALRDRGGRQSLTAFAANRPQDAGEVAVRLQAPGGVVLLGIDQRPKDGQLYGVGSDSRIYVVNPLTGAVTPVGDGPFTPALTSGGRVGFDFNPVADRIRIVTGTGQNLRINPDTGQGAVAPPSAADGNLNGGTTTAEGAAYTNSTKAPATTTLFTLDGSGGNLFLQDPPNAGTTTLVGPLGVFLNVLSGYDIAPRFNHGFAADQSGLYAVNVASTAAAPGQPLGAASGGAVRIGTLPTVALGGESFPGLATFDPALIPPAPTPTPPGGVPPGTVVPTPQPPAATPAKLRTRISTRISPARDRRAPFRYTLRGRIVPKGDAAAGAFAGGRVTVQAKRAGQRRTLRTVRATVSASGSYTVRITVPSRRLARRGGGLVLHQRFGGTDALFSSRAFTRARYR